MVSPFDSITPSPHQVEAMVMLRSDFKSMVERIELLCPASRERSLAITALEQSAMWANKAITHG